MLAKLIEEFRDSLEADSVQKPMQRCRDLFKGVGWRRVADASALDLLRHLERSKWSPSTRNHYPDAAMQFYRWLHRDGRIPKNPIGDVPRFKVAFTGTSDRAAFTEDELRRLIDRNRRLYRADVYALMVFSGLRWVEASRLQVRDIRQEDDGYPIVVPRGKDKSNRGDVIELPDELAPIIERLVGDRGPTGRLLQSGCPTRHTFKRDCERAGIERMRGDGSRIVRYSSRDTYTSLLRVLARSTDQVRALTRHTTRGMEDRYTDRKTQGLRTLVNAMPIVVRTENGRDHGGSAASVHMSVNTPAHAAQSPIPRGFDSPRLHFFDAREGRSCGVISRRGSALLAGVAPVERGRPGWRRGGRVAAPDVVAGAAWWRDSRRCSEKSRPRARPGRRPAVGSKTASSS